MGLSAACPNPKPGGPGYPFSFDLSGMRGPASSYATAGIALRIIWLRKPHHYVKVEIPSVGTKSYYGNQIRENEMQKVKVKLFLYLTKHHAMKAYWGMEI
jgi:hypothetical protein